MEITSWFIVCLACVLGVGFAWFFFAYFALNKKNQTLHGRLTATESNFLRAKEALSQFEKKLAKNQEQHNTMNTHNHEILELRRDNTRLKDEMKKIKEDLRIKDKEFKALESHHIDKLYLATNEKEKLISQLKELDSAAKAQLDETKQQIEQLSVQKNELEDRNTNLEKQAKHHISKIITLQEKFKFAEQEIAKLSKDSAIPKADPQELHRWQERAVCAKKMYQLMRQMRELSDHKVQSYQDGIIAISEWILTNANVPIPSVGDNENKADRLLAEAWTIVISGSAMKPQYEHEQNQDYNALL